MQVLHWTALPYTALQSYCAALHCVAWHANCCTIALRQKEEDLQKAEELANTEAVAAEAAADVKQDACDIRAAPSMDLCSTEEMLSVFDEYYKSTAPASDIKDIARSRISNTCIETGVDVQAKDFDLDLSGQADQVQVPNIDFGTTEPGAWSVDELV